MQKGWVCVLLVAAMMLAVSTAGADENPGAASILLQGGKRGDVTFPHQSHQLALADCRACHDLYGQEPGIIEAMKSSGGLKAQQVMNQQCLKCHRQRKMAGEATGPTLCSKCHVR